MSPSGGFRNYRYGIRMSCGGGGGGSLRRSKSGCAHALRDMQENVITHECNVSVYEKCMLCKIISMPTCVNPRCPESEEVNR